MQIPEFFKTVGKQQPVREEQLLSGDSTDSESDKVRDTKLLPKTNKPDGTYRHYFRLLKGTGKSTIALDTIINQKGQNVICIYCGIGQKNSKIALVYCAIFV